MDAGATIHEAQAHLRHASFSTTATVYAAAVDAVEHDPERVHLRGVSAPLPDRLDHLYGAFVGRFGVGQPVAQSNSSGAQVGHRADRGGVGVGEEKVKSLVV